MSYRLKANKFPADWLLLLFSDQITPHSYWRMQIKKGKGKGKGFDAAPITIRAYPYPVGPSLAVCECSSEQRTGHAITLSLFLAEEFRTLVRSSVSGVINEKAVISAYEKNR